MRIIKLTSDSKTKLMGELLKRTTDDYGEQETIVKEILKNVHDKGDEALFDYTKKFDKADLNSATVKVTEDEIEAAYGEVDEELVEVIRKSMISNFFDISKFCNIYSITPNVIDKL